MRFSHCQVVDSSGRQKIDKIILTPNNFMVNFVLAAASAIAAGWLLRKFREYQWGWVRTTASLKGKLYIVTGANSGIGLEATKVLAKRQATIIMACRNMKRAGDAIRLIRQEVTEGVLVPLELDLTSFASIRAFAEVINTQYPYFDCLINNAGVRVVIAERQTTKEGFEIHAGVNHLGTFLLTRLLVPTNRARIVIVASQMHEMATLHVDDFEVLHEPKGLLTTFDAFNALYDNSKLMNVYFARELYKRGYDVHVLCPGLCATGIFNKQQRWWNLLVFWPFILLFMKSAQQGAQNIVYAATENVNTAQTNPGHGYYVKDVRLTKSRAKLSDVLSEKLWQRSCELCQI